MHAVRTIAYIVRIRTCVHVYIDELMETASLSCIISDIIGSEEHLLEGAGSPCVRVDSIPWASAHKGKRWAALYSLS